MKLTDNNIDKNSARYWCFLSDKTLKDALKEVVKDTNSKTKKKKLNEFVLPVAAAAIGAGKAVLWIAASLGVEWAINKIREEDPEKADQIQQNPRIAFEQFTTNTKSMMRPEDLQNTANQIDDKKFLELCEDFSKIDKYLYGLKDHVHLSEEDINKMMNNFQSLDSNVIGLAYLLNTECGTVEKYVKGGMNDEIDFTKFMVTPDDDVKQKFDPKNRLLNMKHDIAAGKKQLQFDNGKVSIVDIQQDEEKPEEKDSEEDKSEKKDSEEKKPEEKDSEESKQEQAAKQSVSDSPDIQQNSNAVAWIAAAATAAVAVPYLWKRLKQLADYIKSGKTFAKCQFKCTENDQEYVFEYDLNQLQWKLKFAGSTALKYTPYPSDDEVNSFVRTKFAKNFVDKVESQLKNMYSTKDKFLFKAVQAAGKDGSDLIKYLFDNQKSIENSLYGIKKHKLWESIIKKYKIWESTRLQRHRRKLI